MRQLFLFRPRRKEKKDETPRHPLPRRRTSRDQSSDYEDKRNSCLVVFGLDRYITDENLFAYFARYGQLRWTRICQGKYKNYGFVNFEHPIDAQTAIRDKRSVNIAGCKGISVKWSLHKLEESADRRLTKKFSNLNRN